MLGASRAEAGQRGEWGCRAGQGGGEGKEKEVRELTWPFSRPAPSEGVGAGPGRARWPPHQLHHAAADRAGEGVPFQQVPEPGPEGGDRRHPGAQRDAGQDLVPEPAHEAEEARTGGRPGAPSPFRLSQGGSWRRLRPVHVHLPGSFTQLRHLLN